MIPRKRVVPERGEGQTNEYLSEIPPAWQIPLGRRHPIPNTKMGRGEGSGGAKCGQAKWGQQNNGNIMQLFSRILLNNGIIMPLFC